MVTDEHELGVPEVPDFEGCAVCGRTILRGEQISEYLNANSDPMPVCSLCKDRAEAAGWIPIELAGRLARSDSRRRRRGLELRRRVSRAAERVREQREAAAEEQSRRRSERRERRQREAADEPPPPVAAEPPPAPVAAEPHPAAPADQAPPVPVEQAPAAPTGEEPPAPAEEPVAGEAAQPEPVPAGPAYEGGDAIEPSDAEAGTPAAPAPRPVPETRERRMRRAVETFNAGDEPRVIAGLIRSLGRPGATVRQLPGRPPTVSITIAWELSWYRWEVGSNGLSEAGKGGELAEIDDADRDWNAEVTDDGTLRLQPGATREQPAGDGDS